MITRIWHGRTLPQDADAYLQFLLHEGTRDYRHTPGNLSVKVWKEDQPDACHFWTITEWTDKDALVAFAGSNPEKARYYPGDEGILLELEDTVRHHESFDVSGTRILHYIRQLDQLFKGGSWYGESFAEKLKNVDDVTAFLQPVQGIHSIAEIVWHCIYWRNVYLAHVRGGDAGEYKHAHQNFMPRETLKEMGWRRLVGTLEQTQHDILELLRTQNDAFLLRQYEPGKSFDYLTEGIVQHDIYHIGQIGLVTKILGERSSS